MEITLSALAGKRVEELDAYIKLVNENTVDEIATKYLEGTEAFKEALGLVTIHSAINEKERKDEILTVGGTWLKETTVHEIILTQDKLLNLIKLSDNLDEVFSYIVEVADTDAQEHYVLDLQNVTSPVAEVRHLTSTNLETILYADVMRVETKQRELEDLEL